MDELKLAKGLNKAILPESVIGGEKMDGFDVNIKNASCEDEKFGYSLIANGLSEFIKESWMHRSDQYIVYTCKKTGLMVPYNDELQYNPQEKEVNKLHIPYSTKLFLQELEQMNILVRLFTN